MKNNYAIYVGELHPEIKANLFRKISHVLGKKYINTEVIRRIERTIYIVIRNNSLRTWTRSITETLEISKEKADAFYQRENCIIVSFEDFFELATREVR
jgi:hypothetical protein